METETSQERVRTLLGAMTSGNAGTLADLLAEDIAWHVAGNNSLSGTYRGRDEVLGMLERLGTLTGNSFRLELLEVLGGDRHAASITRVEARRDGRTLEATSAGAYTFDEDGSLVELW